jgi:hypothetical protein
VVPRWSEGIEERDVTLPRLADALPTRTVTWYVCPWCGYERNTVDAIAVHLDLYHRREMSDDELRALNEHLEMMQ